MSDAVISIILFVLSATFLSLALILRRTRARLASKSLKNTSSMLRLAAAIRGKVRKFR
jgi:hypothetical protein